MRIFTAFSIALIAALVLLPAGAFAFITQSEADIRVGETPKDYTFTVENKSAATKALVLSFVMPSRHEVIAKPQWVGAKSTGQVKIRIYPDSRLEGTTYTAKIKAELGGDIAEKVLTINYIAEDKCTIDTRAGFADYNQGPSKIALTFTNGSYKAKAIELAGISGAPQDWKLEGGNTFTIGPFETRQFETGLERKSPFSGGLGLVFRCAGTEFTQKIDVSAPKKGDEGAFAGFAVLAEGIASADFAFILDAFLIIIAAVLLIAFIARLVHFMGRGAKQ